jgi:hypothetical protein
VWRLSSRASDAKIGIPQTLSQVLLMRVTMPAMRNSKLSIVWSSLPLGIIKGVLHRVIAQELFVSRGLPFSIAGLLFVITMTRALPSLESCSAKSPGIASTGFSAQLGGKLDCIHRRRISSS